MVILGISEKRLLSQYKRELCREEDKQEGTFRVREKKISPEHNNHQDETLGEQMMETDHPSVW
jgi:hypothetical protein